MSTGERPPAGDGAGALSALVVLRPAGGASAGPATAESVAAMLPEQAAVAAVRDWFVDHGFDVTAMHGNSMAIQGPAPLFARTFKEAGPPEPGRPLPLELLPDEVSRHIEAIATTPPPDFGPPP